MISLEEFIDTTQACSDDETLFRQFDIFVGAYGVDVSSYHIVAEQLRAIPIEIGLIRETFPTDWLEHYLEQSYAEIDPMIQQSRREARPFHWFEVDKRLNLNPRQKAFLEDLRQAGMTDGLAIPVFGPKGTMAYFGLGTVNDTLQVTEADKMELQFACLQTHNRYMDLSNIADETMPIKRLSPRESEVLSLVAAGLSNNFIADELGISENTVDTMLRRVFAKLNVNNRISAVLRGIGSGLILP